MWERKSDREQIQIERKKERGGEREREREKEMAIKHRGSYHTFFLLKGAVCKKQDHSLQSSTWVQIKNIVFDF